MNRDELYKGASIKDNLETHIFDYWHEWRVKQAGISREDEEAYRASIYAMPAPFIWDIDYQTNEMRIRWCDGEERIPINWFYDDEEDHLDLELVWHENYYDGPLSGVAKMNGEYVWMELIEEDEVSGDRLFGLYSMKPEHKAEVFRRHKLFQECVGYHCDHDPEVHRPYGTTDNSRFKEFYKMKFKELGLQNSDRLVADAYWFEFKNWGRPRYEEERS